MAKKEFLNKARAICRRLGPWIVAALILAILFWRIIDLDEFVQAFQQANLYLYLPLMIGFVLIWFLGESQNLTALFRHFRHQVSYKEVLNLRGVTYLLMILNYGLGVGGIALYMNRAKGIPFWRASSLMLFYMFTETVSLSAMVVLSCLFTSERSPLMNQLFIICGSILLAYALGVVIFKNLPRKGFFQKIKDWTLLKTFGEASLKDYLLLTFWRGLYFTTFILFFFLAVKTFHIINIPLGSLASFVPIIFFIGNLPITVSGLGTIQAAMLFFFQGYSTSANVMAFSITYSTTLLLFRIPIGLYYLRKTPLSLFRGAQNSGEA